MLHNTSIFNFVHMNWRQRRFSLCVLEHETTLVITLLSKLMTITSSRGWGGKGEQGTGGRVITQDYHSGEIKRVWLQLKGPSGKQVPTAEEVSSQFDPELGEIMVQSLGDLGGQGHSLTDNIEIQVISNLTYKWLECHKASKTLKFINRISITTVMSLDYNISQSLSFQCLDQLRILCEKKPSTFGFLLILGSCCPQPCLSFCHGVIRVWTFLCGCLVCFYKNTTSCSVSVQRLKSR